MREEAVAEWARAVRCLASSRELLRIEDPDGCASRAYYAAFHAMSALFLLEGQAFRKHEAIAAAVHRDLVHAKRVGPIVGEDFTLLLQLRMVGDYGVKKGLNREDAGDAVARAERILGEVRRLARGALA